LVEGEYPAQFRGERLEEMEGEKDTRQNKDTAETRGERLSRLRKAKGLTLEKVHKRTKIHIEVLKALEQDAVSDMAPAYVSGLLKIYCHFLGVDPKDFIGEPVQDRMMPALPLDKPRVNVSVIKDQFRLKPVIIVVGLVFLAIVAFKFGKNISLYRESRLKKQPAAVKKVSKAAKRDSANVQSAAPVPLVSSSVVSEPKLGIRAKEDCWLEVKIDGKTIFRNILKKGHFEYWEAKKRIEFSLGNAGGVEVEVNGKLFSPLGRRGQVIKNIIITKEGLRVPK
jgi:cytoskeleton protein RodZ